MSLSGDAARSPSPLNDMRELLGQLVGAVQDGNKRLEEQGRRLEQARGADMASVGVAALCAPQMAPALRGQPYCPAWGQPLGQPCHRRGPCSRVCLFVACLRLRALSAGWGCAVCAELTTRWMLGELAACR